MRSNAPTRPRAKKSRSSTDGKPLCTTDIRVPSPRLERDLDVRGHRRAVGAAAGRLGDQPVRAVDDEERLGLAEQGVAVRPPDGGLLAADAQVDLDLHDAGLLVEDGEPDLLLLGVGVGVEHLLRGGGQARHAQLEGGVVSS